MLFHQRSKFEGNFMDNMYTVWQSNIILVLMIPRWNYFVICLYICGIKNFCSDSPHQEEKPHQTHMQSTNRHRNVPLNEFFSINSFQIPLKSMPKADIVICVWRWDNKEWNERLDINASDRFGREREREKERGWGWKGRVIYEKWRRESK